ncbi:hypothetical protein ESCO_006301 [Escovopsis weberi]|uniref:Trans-aconitate 2-methyltransferase n=1 Tax=Escovopsis weberi TaxID=150374 RepID=A0A0M8N536_ESCWE|nr:hypothetical protein ESCO_006301 [Escovopsis weberi]
MSCQNDVPKGDEESESNLDGYEFTFHPYRGAYHLPCDALEQERMEFQNALLVKCSGDQLIFSPFSESNPPRSILDIATGTGDWPMAIGDLFPTAKIIATDLSPIQPIDVPPNVTFFVEDSSEPWIYDEKFDYIHTRNTASCWSDFETQVAQQAFESLVPGGWFEAQELYVLPHSDDGTLAPDSALSLWCEDLHAAAAVVDRPLGWMPQLRSIFERVGFVDVKVRVFKMPLNGWPKDEKLKELGQMWEWNMQTGIKGLSSSFFHHAYDRSEAEIEVSNPEIHAYLPFYVVWGRKPVKPKKGKPESNVRR